MKISASAFNNSNDKPTESKHVLPLIPAKEEEAPSEQKITHTLYSDPAHPDTSSKYKVTIRILSGEEDCRQLITWHKNVLKVLSGLNVTTHTGARPIVETLMTSRTRGIFVSDLEAVKLKTMQTRISVRARRPT